MRVTQSDARRVNQAYVLCWRMNNPLLGDSCIAMIGKANLNKGSKNYERLALGHLRYHLDRYTTPVKLPT